MTQFEQKMNVLDLPNQYIDFEANFVVSCALDNSDALLRYFEGYLNKWVEENYSVHQFAQRYAADGISLWTVNESEELLSKQDLERKAALFYLVSEKNEIGYVLVHCYLSHQDSLQ